MDCMAFFSNMHNRTKGILYVPLVVTVGVVGIAGVVVVFGVAERLDNVAFRFGVNTDPLKLGVTTA